MADAARPALAATDPGAALSAPEFDRLLAAWPRAHLLQSHGWGRLQSTAGWAVCRLVCDAGEGRRLPLTVLVGGAGVPGLPARVYVPKGPACAPDDAPAWAAALEALAGLAGSLGAATVTLEPPAWEREAGAVWARLAAAPGPRWRDAVPVQPRHTAVVDLAGGEERVLERMRPKGRYNVRLAGRRGVTVRTESDPDRGAAALAALTSATAQRQGIALPGARYYRDALEALPGARVHVASVEGEDCAAALVADFAGEAIYLYGGSGSRHRERQPSALLHFEAMRLAVGRGCHAYDLWGLPPGGDPAHPWHGLRQFKLSLGGVEATTVGAFSQLRRPVAGRAVVASLRLRSVTRSLLRRSRRVGGFGVQSPAEIREQRKA